ncbi:MAG TPA: NAD(P)-binding domain-containing protein [Candidatus Dormibacteraeota bacterium]|nr:NAD(P)-binding domain-containing protein [Candidatus Dormibacteraeota bacterium]
MTTAIVGVGTMGSRLAERLVAGGERVVVAARDEERARALAMELGPLASAGRIEFFGDLYSRILDADEARAAVDAGVPGAEG